MHIRLVAGGTASWATPVRVDENTWRANFETLIVHRYTLEDGRHVHVKTRYTGVDEVDAEGIVTAGSAGCDGVDQDGDSLHGRIDFIVNDAPSEDDWGRGIFTFAYGTGKWEGVSGSIDASVWAQPTAHDQQMPPVGPIRFWGFIEGDGELELPGLSA